MPESIVRFLRVYASVVLLLVSSVLAYGVEPVADKVDFSNVTTVPIEVGAARVAYPMLPQQPLAFEVFEAIAYDAQVFDRIAANALSVRSLARAQPESSRDASVAKLCGHAILRVRRQS